MRDTREKKLKDFEQLLWYIRSVIEMSTVTIEDEEIAPELHHVIITQNRIGAVKLLQGYLSTAWVQAMEDYGEKCPNCRMAAILRGLWDELFEPIWATRNHILHHLPNRYNDAIEKSNKERLQWYYDIESKYCHSTIGNSPNAPKNKSRPCDRKQSDNGCENSTTYERYTRLSYSKSNLVSKCCLSTLTVLALSNRRSTGRATPHYHAIKHLFSIEPKFELSGLKREQNISVRIKYGRRGTTRSKLCHHLLATPIKRETSIAS
jgi:hypothetical protein